MTITVSCPSCSTSFPVDPAKIPEGGVNARCTSCGNVFFVEKPDDAAAEAAPPPAPEAPAVEAPPAEAPAPDTGVPDDAFTAPEAETEEDDWVIEREPDMTGGGDFGGAAAEPVETVESAQDPPGFGGPAEGIETAEPPATESTGMADDDAAPMGSGDFAAAGAAAEPAAPEAPSEPAAGGFGAPAETGDFGGPPEEHEPEERTAEEGAAPDALPEPEAKPQAFQFGKRDPHEKARRLARVLVSDMIMYNPERHSKALEQGSLESDFEDEIKKSWEEFVDQVGEEIAHGNSYFTDALNEILAKGEQLFHGQPGD